MEEQYTFPPQPEDPRFPVQKRELIYGAALLVSSVFLWNCILFGGMNLGFVMGYIALNGCTIWYLKASGHRFDGYSTALLALSLVITLGFARSNDGFVKLVMTLFLLFSVNLSYCLVTGQNRRHPGTIGSVLDVPRAFFVLGVANLGASARGLNDARKNAGNAGKQSSAALMGIALAIPVMFLLISLLMKADAAFEGLMELLPEPELQEPLQSLAFGAAGCWILFSRSLGLHFSQQKEGKKSDFTGISPITVNILMSSVCLVYLVYLFSQLAYLSGGLSGILPEGFTMAQYARRGFFEMAWLSAINLGLMCLAMGLVEKKAKPRFTKGTCLFLGMVTLFLITTASAKMFLYIGSYGLTRLRVLTQVIMVWLAITTVLVCVWLFKPKFAYMKAVVLAALVLGAAVIWADVDTLVARYNVRAYQSGQLQTVDVSHLRSLGSGAVPYLQELTGDADPKVAEAAEKALKNRYTDISDYREWNWAEAKAMDILESCREQAEVTS